MPTELKNVLLVEDPTGISYCLGTLSATEIKQLTMVPVVSESQPGETDREMLLNEDSTNGYQRAGEARRMSAITNFVRSRPECVIPPVLLSCRGKWRFIPNAKNSMTGSLRAEELAAIVDGQHRLGGMWRLTRQEDAPEEVRGKPIPFMAVMDMDVERERQEFVDINNNQRGVKKSLIRYLERDDSFAGRAAAALMEDEESVFRGRIDEQRRRDWTIVLFGAAQECVKEMFGPLLKVKFNPEKSDRQQESGLVFVLKYWQIVSDSFPDYWADMRLMPSIGSQKSGDFPGRNGFQYRLLEETGIRAFARLANEVLTYAWIEGASAPSWDTVEDLMRKLSKSELVELILTKPIRNAAVEKFNPLLKSTGKAGVELIFTYLRSELVSAMQNR